MEPEGSLPHSQMPTTCPYPEPDLSSPHTPHSTPRRFILILYSHLCQGLPSGLFPSCFLTRILYAHHHSHTCYISRPSHFSRFDRPNTRVGTLIVAITCIYLQLIQNRYVSKFYCPSL